MAVPPRTLLCLTREIAGQRLTYALAPGRHGIGSDATNRVVIDDEGVSRRHAEVVVGPEVVELRDRESKNGTFVNGGRVRRAVIVIGDRVAFGPVTMVLASLDPDDAELAIELDGAEDAKSRRDPTTTATRHSTARLPSRWFRLLCQLLEHLSQAGGGDRTTALAALVDGLGADGAAMVEGLFGSAPAIVVACGEIDGPTIRRARESLVASGGDSFSDPSGSAQVIQRGETSVALLVTGDFVGRGESQRFLRAALLILEQLRAHTELPDEVRGDDETQGLTLPPGCVRGVAATMQTLYAQLRPLAAVDLPVLLLGETGSGKEVLARTLHRSSKRRDGPFVALNCAALPVELLEAELFGIGAGVATGVKARAGKFQQAEGGTLFLDEIATMAPGLQAKLLRALEEGEVTPLGARPVAVDIRLVAATNADIFALMDDGRFRRDLFYRVAGSVLRVPPLRERRADIPLLVESFLRSAAAEADKRVRGVTVAALEALIEHDWPGNVRELRNEIRRLAAFCPPGQAVGVAALSEGIRAAAADPHAQRAAAGTSGSDRLAREGAAEGASLPTLELAELERLAVRVAMRSCADNQVQAADLLGISRFALRRRLNRYQH